MYLCSPKKMTKMTKSKNFLFALLIGAGLFASCNQATTETAAVATTATDSVSLTTDSTSNVAWKGTMLKMYSHTGSLAISNGNFTVKNGKITAGKFTADLKTMVPTDSNYEATGKRTKANLVGHLSSPDFFDVANNPTANFEITGVSEDGKTVNGNLTVRGKTNAEKVENVSYDAATKTATGTLTFNRQTYGIAYKAAMKDMVLSDDIELTITLHGK